MSKEKLKEILQDKELVELLKQVLKEPEKPKRKYVKKVATKKRPAKRAKPVKEVKIGKKEFYNNYVDNLPKNENISRLDVLDAKNRLKHKKIPERTSKFIKKKCEKCNKEFEAFFMEVICDSCIGGYRASR